MFLPSFRSSVPPQLRKYFLRRSHYGSKHSPHLTDSDACLDDCVGNCCSVCGIPAADVVPAQQPQSTECEVDWTLPVAAHFALPW
jgi:hypothetical protein